ncbi:unnamed protein product [Arabidopsis thaliana]|uniref:(thale cress) hypothetical protein n=1 Tax=Arabidopsis thaliana TaxID=3702 RepID=A0A7G2EL33_ARATH|nr:unnamed protein product [Arabidopsis thaliana]
MATPTPSLSPPPLNLWIILSESKRIINAHSRHFLALSVLFLLPLCFSITVYPSVFLLITDQSSASHNTVSLLRGGLHNNSDDDIDTKTTVLLVIGYIVVITVFNLLAIGSIAYSVFQGFYGRPVKLNSAVKSSFASFLPLLATLTSSNLIVLGGFLIPGILAFVLVKLIETIPGVEFDYASSYFQAWGITPLKRSKRLVKGMKCASLSIIFFFASTESILVWISTLAAYAQLNDNENGGKSWTDAFFVVQIVITSAFLTLLTLYNLAATTVMYMYCKAVHGELVWEIAEEFAREYVSLPFDDGKVPHLVSVAYNNI